ncbi:hypothetical protein GOC38_28800 [Sinorhizobium meliloti]|nr:hypothetical protein [Sinorhizobium meliloti]MDX0321576.1 hypothetical protein [Sinorhizobium meliloti]MDX0328018.1 hypothetical protein [Sinorhizobium meliloti]
MADDQSVAVNSLVWITSLRENEQGVTRRVLEDLVPYLEELGVGVTIYEPKAADELLYMLDLIREATEGIVRPIVHIDMHGHPTNGLHIVESGEDVPWAHLTEMFREINIRMGNTLCVVSLACFGFHILSEGALDLTRTTPFYALIASENEIGAGAIEERAVRFYRELFEVKSLSEACVNIWDDILRVWRSEVFAFEVLINYILRFTKGKGLRERKERLLTEARRRNVVTDANISEFRKLVKRALRPTPGLIARTERSFFGGRKLSFTFEQLMHVVAIAERKVRRENPHDGSRPLARVKRH